MYVGGVKLFTSSLIIEVNGNREEGQGREGGQLCMHTSVNDDGKKNSPVILCPNLFYGRVLKFETLEEAGESSLWK